MAVACSASLHIVSVGDPALTSEVLADELSIKSVRKGLGNQRAALQFCLINYGLLFSPGPDNVRFGVVDHHLRELAFFKDLCSESGAFP